MATRGSDIALRADVLSRALTEAPAVLDHSCIARSYQDRSAVETARHWSTSIDTFTTMLPSPSVDRVRGVGACVDAPALGLPFVRLVVVVDEGRFVAPLRPRQRRLRAERARHGTG